jgi:asparagine synthase (glutamine-hydrolysing)
MSGIAAIIRFDGAPIERGLIEKMMNAMSYRGPDAINHWVKDSVALGHCMLRTTVESLEETQPLCCEDQSLVLVMDGRLDNWEELRSELLSRGAKLRSRADAELVLRAYEAWGKECLAHIDGDFAFVIWDQRRREAFCARDHMGNKPLHYHWDGRRLIVASDLHPIFGASVSQTPNQGMIAEILAGEWYSRDETMWREVMRLVAAHHMTVGADGLRIERYWSPPLDVTIRYKRDEEYFEHYRELFADCVRRTSRSHLPVAYEVSGGHDSSAVFCMAEHLRKAGRLPAPAIKGYTLAFEEEGDANENAYMRAVRDHLGIPIHETAPTRRALSWFREQAQKEQDFPGFPNAAMFADMREVMVARGSRVVLNGEGGDDWLEGSRLYYAEELAGGEWGPLYDSFRADVATFGYGRPIYWLLRHGLFHQLPEPIKNAARKLRRRSRASLQNGAYWLSSQMFDILVERRSMMVQSHTDRPSRIGQLALLWRLNAVFAAQMKERIDRSGAQFGLELRAPMHRRKYVEWAFGTPERMRQRGGVRKFIHVQALAGLLPATVVYRSNKAHFDFMFRHRLDRMRRQLVEMIPQEQPDWVTAEGMARLYQAYSERSLAGAPMWELWAVFACYCLLCEGVKSSFSLNGDHV